MCSYYSLIHLTYPILPAKEKLKEELGNCSPLIKDAFNEALYAAVRSSPFTFIPPLPKRSTAKALQLTVTSALETPSMRSFPRSNIVYLQIILLMAIEASNCGPSPENRTLRPLSFWLANGVALAHQMKLHVYKKPAINRANPAGYDADTEDKIERRLWWSLIVMDRFYGSSTASPEMVPEDMARVYPTDQFVLGGTLYALARKYRPLSYIDQN